MIEKKEKDLVLIFEKKKNKKKLMIKGKLKETF
jgi:hypothetical protein